MRPSAPEGPQEGPPCCPGAKPRADPPPGFPRPAGGAAHCAPWHQTLQAGHPPPGRQLHRPPEPDPPAGAPHAQDAPSSLLAPTEEVAHALHPLRGLLAWRSPFRRSSSHPLACPWWAGSDGS